MREYGGRIKRRGTAGGGGGAGGVEVEIDVTYTGGNEEELPVAGKMLRITECQTDTFEQYVIGTDKKVKDSLAFLRNYHTQLENDGKVATAPVYFSTGWRSQKINIPASFKNTYDWYGVEWDVTATSPSMTRIAQGNDLHLHSILPVQSLMAGVLLTDGGTIVRYLNPDDWRTEILDGTEGQVMVELPEHWRKFEADGNIRRVKMALGEFEGAHRVPKRYISAYEAMADTSSVSAATKLCSVVNTGSNAGKPLVGTTLTNFRNYARNRGNGSKWNCLTYKIRDEIAWLFYVEYAHRNGQADFNAEKTVEGYSQGGLGAVPAGYNTVPCGQTNNYGNRTFAATVGSYGNCYRYRGIEFPFGHNWHWTDGILFDGATVYVSTEAGTYADAVNAGYVNVGSKVQTGGYVREILFGDQGYIIPTNVTGGSATTYWTDNYWQSTGVNGLISGGHVGDGTYCGFACTATNGAPSYAAADFGSRLCFLPEDA
jgi:hypothetical protein